MKTEKIQVSGRNKTYLVKYGVLPEVEYEVISPEVAVESYRAHFSLSPERPYKSYTIKEVKNG